MTRIELGGVCERDVDLLLLEEIVVSPEFLRWFLEQLHADIKGTLVAACRSVTAPNGESDIELTLADGSAITKVLIENKVDAQLQPRQAERYAERAQSYRTSRECTKVVTALIAPAGYKPDNHAFDRSLTYEAILEQLGTLQTDSGRAAYKCAVLRQAIERGSSGWTLVPDQPATAFWHRYWELAGGVAPELAMPQPGPKPATSGFIRFRPARLPRNVALIHKAPYGNVDLQFAGMAERIQEFDQRYRASLEAGMRLKRANKALVVRMEVPRVYLRAPFETSEPAVRQALKAAQRLLNWYGSVMNSLGAT